MRESLAFIPKYCVKTAGFSKQFNVPLMKGPFSFCPSLHVLFWIPGQEEEKHELIVRANNVLLHIMGFLFSWVLVGLFLGWIK